MHAGGKGAERQQRENCQPGRAGREDSCTLGNNSKFITTRNASQCSACVVSSAPAQRCRLRCRHPFADTDQPDDRRENFPIANNRLLGDSLYRRRQVLSGSIPG